MTAPYAFSIIIPTHGRPERLSQCLSSLTHLSGKTSFEVVVVDDGSEEPLDQVLGPFQSRLQLNHIRQAQSGPATARNVGAAVAQGDSLAFTDDDCQPAPDWLDKLAATLRRQPNCLVGGTTINLLTQNSFSSASQLLVDYLYSELNADHDAATFFTSNNMAMPAEAFHRSGGFSVDFPLAAGEDREFCDRWRSQGRQLKFVPDALVYHSHELSLRSYWRQQFAYGRGAHRVHAKRRQEYLRPAPLPSRLSFYANLLAFPIRCNFCGSVPDPKLDSVAVHHIESKRCCSLLNTLGLFVLAQIAVASGLAYESFNSRVPHRTELRSNPLGGEAC